MKKTVFDDDILIVEQNGLYGLEDRNSRALTEIEYESVLPCFGGFILTKNGKCGYVDFSQRDVTDEDSHGVCLGAPNANAAAWIACVYDSAQIKRNGISLRNVNYAHDIPWSEDWYDCEEHRVYRDISYINNYCSFDCFVDEAKYPYALLLKRAGHDQWIKFSTDTAIGPWREIPLDDTGVRCVLCTNQFPDSENEYSFMLCSRSGWGLTASCSSLEESYGKLPEIVKCVAELGGDESIAKLTGAPVNPYIKYHEI